MKKADWIVIAVVAAVVGILVLALYGLNAGSGAYVQIEIDGTVTETLPLTEDTTRVITTEGGTNTLTIQDGYAAITEADCPDKICQKHPKINKNGETIICLPHKLVISIADDKAEDEVDLAG